MPTRPHSDAAEPVDAVADDGPPAPGEPAAAEHEQTSAVPLTSVDSVKKRPVSYPWGPEARLEVLEVPENFEPSAKRSSDPPKPTIPVNKAKTQVKPFTKESLERLEKKTVQLVREYGFQPRRKLSVEDGSRLPAKYEPFPQKLYGKPLEEIDNFIYDEVNFCRTKERAANKKPFYYGIVLDITQQQHFYKRFL
ncbi:unnamed protein product [Brassicogethes aeneus]|uniref:Uncharacterized protein n=1 Tax=Brassicogethes aeneus TaxID=1431903 RepID=A0A9P0FF34_BRAAE|nr:unnamed protein product [Brassicogethes aeneus]